MATFHEVNQVRLAMKMKLSVHAWYIGSRVYAIDDGFGVLVVASQIDNGVRKLVNPVVDGVSVKVETEVRGKR